MKHLGKTNKITACIRSVILATVGISSIYVPHSAATNSDQTSQDSITLTGSRLSQSKSTESSSVITIDSKQLELFNTVNVETFLNQLPQFIPGQDRSSNNPGDGIATLDLYGLGANRTLILINGKRATPRTADGIVDVNSIPMSLVERVEIYGGAASVAHGSGAVSGVVNFILNDNFEGINVNAGYEITEESDGQILNTNITFGNQFSGGKGHVVFNVSYSEREALLGQSRTISSNPLFDDGIGGLETGGSSGVPATSIFSGGFGGFFVSGIIFNQDGSFRPFDTEGIDNDFYNYAPVNYIQLPQERLQVNTLVKFQINEQAELYGSALFTDNQLSQQQAPTPMFQASTFTLDQNPFLTPASQQAISDAIGLGVDTDGDGIDDEARALIRRRLTELGPRQTLHEISTFQTQFGLKGNFGDSDWGYDVYFQTGTSKDDLVYNGAANRDRFQQSLLLDLQADPNGGSCIDNSNNGSTVSCTPINIFGENNISPEGVAFISNPLSSESESEQNIVSLNIQGDTGQVIELPGGPIRISAGIEHISNEFEFVPSRDLVTGNFAGPSIQRAFSGDFDSTEFYSEFYLPVSKNDEDNVVFDFSVGLRAADYSTFGSASSYYFASSWTPNELIQVNAKIGSSFKAPSIYELYGPQSENFPVATDPCSSQGFPGQGDLTALRALCEATGVPANNVFTPVIDPAVGQIRSLLGGNPNLSEEESETLTIGLVTSPTDAFTFGLEYFDIQIENGISQFSEDSSLSVSNILNTCYFDPVLGGLGSSFCNSIIRRADGTIDFVNRTQANTRELSIKGFNIQSNFHVPLGKGEFNINYHATLNDEFSLHAFPGAEGLNCSGKFGRECQEPRPEYKHLASVNWTTDSWTYQLDWRYVGEVKDGDNDTVFAVEKIGGVNYFDTSFAYRYNDNFKFIFGIKNLFAEEATVIGDNDGQANTYPATYDIFGRTFFLNMSAIF